MYKCGIEIEATKHFFLWCQFHVSETHDLHDALCLIDPTAISFDGESQLNALLYGSDEFDIKINKEILSRIIPNRADDTGVAEVGPGLPLFFVAKIKKGSKEKKKTIQSRNY